MNRLILVVIGALLVLAVPGCAEKTEGGGGSHKKDKFNIILDYFPNADHAGIYAAQAAGDYDRAGLDVDIKPPPDPSAPLKLLRTGQADVVISYEPELLLARDKGADLVSVAALVQKPLTTLMTLDGTIHSPADLRDKRVGTAGIPYQTAYLKTILEDAGVDPKSVEETHVGYNLVPAMLSRKVDATLGAFWNYEGTDLRRRGRKPTILKMDKLGVPTYDELIIVARRRTSTRSSRPSCGASCARRPRATSGCASTPRSASTRC
jgi:putative hydroxymethylpyrimidine transport system substrate-binding protein